MAACVKCLYVVVVTRERAGLSGEDSIMNRTYHDANRTRGFSDSPDSLRVDDCAARVSGTLYGKQHSCTFSQVTLNEIGCV